jgi:hypothetical protein
MHGHEPQLWTYFVPESLSVIGWYPVNSNILAPKIGAQNTKWQFSQK